jgi:hypothetical protein
MNKRGFFLPFKLIWFLAVILVVGYLTMAWLPNHLSTWFNIVIGTAQIIGTVLLLAILGLLKFVGII